MRYIEHGNPEAAEYQGGHDSYRDGIIVLDQADQGPKNNAGDLLLEAPKICAEVDPYEHKKGRVFANVHPLQTGRAYGIRFWTYADGSRYRS